MPLRAQPQRQRLELAGNFANAMAPQVKFYSPDEIQKSHTQLARHYLEASGIDDDKKFTSFRAYLPGWKRFIMRPAPASGNSRYAAGRFFPTNSMPSEDRFRRPADMTRPPKYFGRCSISIAPTIMRTTTLRTISTSRARTERTRRSIISGALPTLLIRYGGGRAGYAF